MSPYRDPGRTPAQSLQSMRRMLARERRLAKELRAAALAQTGPVLRKSHLPYAALKGKAQLVHTFINILNRHAASMSTAARADVLEEMRAAGLPMKPVPLGVQRAHVREAKERIKSAISLAEQAEAQWQQAIHTAREAGGRKLLTDRAVRSARADVMANLEYRVARTAATEGARTMNLERKFVRRIALADTPHYVQWDATLDKRTCSTCLALHGKRFPKGDEPPPPPIHPRCRCIIRAVPRKKSK